MPYVDSELALERLSDFIRDEVRPEFEESDQLLHAQLGSLSSTLSFISKEQHGRVDSVRQQRAALLEATDSVDEILADIEDDTDSVEQVLVRAREELAESDVSDTRETEKTILSSANDILEAIDADLDGRGAARAREPIYGFLRARVEAQFDVLGRET